MITLSIPIKTHGSYTSIELVTEANPVSSASFLGGVLNRFIIASGTKLRIY